LKPPDTRKSLRVRWRRFRQRLGLWVSLPFELLIEFWDHITGTDAGYDNCWWDK
jgi:hypothetical protein